MAQRTLEDEFLEGLFGTGRVIRHFIPPPGTSFDFFLCGGAGWGTENAQNVTCPKCLERLHAEDTSDAHAVEKAIAEGGETFSHEQVGAELGLRNDDA
jgi:hypothetical protein